MSTISGYSSYSNILTGYGNTGKTNKSDALNAFDSMQNMQLSLVNALSANDIGSDSTGSGEDIFMSTFSAQLNKIMVGLEAKDKQKFDSNMNSIMDAIDKGDFEAAKTAYSRVYTDSGQNTQKDKDFMALKKAIDANDAKAAKEALATIKQHDAQARLENSKNLGIDSKNNAYLQNMQGNLADITSSFSSLV